MPALIVATVASAGVSVAPYFIEEKKKN